MRLIDADALRKCFEVPHELKCGIQAGMDEYALKCIDEQPTVAASPWYRVEEPPKYSGKVFVLLNREGPFYDTELVADTATYNCLPRGPVPVGTFYKGMFGKSDFEDITKNVLYWMPIELPKEKKI